MADATEKNICEDVGTDGEFNRDYVRHVWCDIRLVFRNYESNYNGVKLNENNVTEAINYQSG